MQNSANSTLWTSRTSLTSNHGISSSPYDRDHCHASNQQSPSSDPVPRSLPAISSVDLSSTTPRFFQQSSTTPALASATSSTMSSFYPADFSHSAPGTAGGPSANNNNNNAYPPRAGLDNSRPYTMAGYMGPSGTGNGATAGTTANPGAGTGPSPYHGGAEYLSGGSAGYHPGHAAGTAAGSAGGANVLTGYRPATSHETFSGQNYSYPSSRSSFSAYGPAGAGHSAYGSSAVPPGSSSSSTAAPYHHGAYSHAAAAGGYGGPTAGAGTSSGSGVPAEYAAYPAQASADPTSAYPSGVPGYANPTSAGYTYGGSQAGIYPGSHVSQTPASGSVAPAPGCYGFQHTAGPAIHYLNPFEVKHRRRTTKQQFRVLEGTFKENPKPNANLRKSLAQQLDMPGRAVQIWFQNRRAKAKAQAKKEEQATRERAATSEGSTSTGKTNMPQSGSSSQAGHARSATAPQPTSSANTSTDSYGSRTSPGQGDYRHSQLASQQQQQQQHAGAAYGQMGGMQQGHHGASSHHAGGPTGWHAGHSSGSRN
ncbi:hypothetical protein V8E36_002382 [Tilletia maclaganii]